MSPHPHSHRAGPEKVLRDTNAKHETNNNVCLTMILMIGEVDDAGKNMILMMITIMTPIIVVRFL